MSDTKTTFIYALVDPRDGRIRYVGKANNPYERLRSHIMESNSSKILCTNKLKKEWLLSLTAVKLRPITIVLQEVSLLTWEQSEREWIAKTKLDFPDLLNTCIGGNGHSIHTPEAVAKIKKANTGLIRSAEAKARMSAAQKGKKISQEQIVKMQAGRPKEVSLETRAKISKALLNLSPETKQRIKEDNRKAKYGVPRPQITKDRVSKTLMGHNVSEETKAKIRAANTNPSIETRRKISEAVKNISEETRMKMRIAHSNRSDKTKNKTRCSVRKLWEDPEYRLRISNAVKQWWKKKKEKKNEYQ